MEIHRAAFKHGIAAADIVHAYAHPLVIVELDPDSDPPKVLVIGPDRSGNLLEVIALDLAEDVLLAIHAMRLRARFHELLPPSETHDD